MIGIYSFPHGISLNPRQWALDEYGELVEFETVDSALLWINERSDEALDEDGWSEYGIHFGEVEEYDPSHSGSKITRLCGY